MTGTVALLVVGPLALAVGVAQLAGWMPLRTRRERRVFGSAFVGLGAVALGVGLVQWLLGWWTG